jgi:hypothetical protein
MAHRYRTQSYLGALTAANGLKVVKNSLGHDSSDYVTVKKLTYQSTTRSIIRGLMGNKTASVTLFPPKI